VNVEARATLSKGLLLFAAKMCAYGFQEDKIKSLRTVYDRLSLAKQLAGGWLPQWIVNSVVKQMEKGPH